MLVAWILSIVLNLSSNITAQTVEDYHKYLEFQERCEQVKQEEDERLYQKRLYEPPIPFILDMDFSTDVDDVCAVRIATSLAKLGQIDLKAVGLCTRGENNLSALNGMLNQAGYGDVPLGRSFAFIEDTSEYWGTLSAFARADFPIEESVSLYRRILSESEKPVVICTTGYLQNISALLKSQPDGCSDKIGVDLVREKCRGIYVTGGSYPTGFDNNFFATYGAVDAVQTVVNLCPVDLYFVTQTVGGAFTCGDLIQKLDTGMEDPLTRALSAWGTEIGRHAWDPESVYVASVGLEQSKTIAVPVQFTIESNGRNTFTVVESSNVYAVLRESEDLNWYKTTLNNLTLVGTKWEIKDGTETEGS